MRPAAVVTGMDDYMLMMMKMRGEDRLRNARRGRRAAQARRAARTRQPDPRCAADRETTTRLARWRARTLSTAAVRTRPAATGR